jgi:predicted ester cyclase
VSNEQQGHRAPDLHITIEDLVEEGDRVAVRWRATGTLTGDGFGVPPTGKRMDMGGGMTIARVHNGRIAEAWNNFDFFGMHYQLGTLSSVAARLPPVW